GKLATTSLYLKQPINVSELPGFSLGSCSVQDEAAQLAAQIMKPKEGELILDACCAPGGKTGHLLEASQGLAKITALDSDAKRLQRVHENLERLGYTAKVLQGEAQAPENWWDGQAFDGILLDVPCSATGVIRRHPDIKLLRQREDIDNLAQLQQAILSKAWTLLKPGGRLLYATCSVTQAENQNNIEAFLQTHPDSELVQLHFNTGLDTKYGWQFFPDKNAQDGFFYALLRKEA
ncbi:methyltransferase domain-containing protein, partial [Bermanella marisrubri]